LMQIEKDVCNLPPQVSVFVIMIMAGICLILMEMENQILLMMENAYLLVTNLVKILVQVPQLVLMIYVGELELLLLIGFLEPVMILLMNLLLILIYKMILM
jgi:hypothetical protein